jgi:hypothetical protein
MLLRLKHVRGLTVEEKSVHAVGLAATPQERWDLFENCVRSAGFWKPNNEGHQQPTRTANRRA